MLLLNRRNMPVKNILSIVPYKVLPAKMGGEKGIALFNEYLGKLVDLTAVSVRSNEVKLAKNYRMLNIFSDSRARYANVFLYFTIRKLIRKYKASHLLIEHPYYAWLAWMIRLTMPVKWVIHSHNIEYMRSRSIGRKWWPALKWYEQWAYRKADLIFFISEDDRKHAIEKMGIKASKTVAITYGIEQDSLPDDRQSCREKIAATYGIQPGEKILLFNGALGVISNYEAVQIILDHINPFLIKQGLKYKILICGKGLPASFNDLKGHENVIHAGFVDDISLFFKAADIFLNPITSGAGVKTKAIEALSNNNTVVSTELGALGLERSVCGEKLVVVPDQDWKAFNEALLKVFDLQSDLPEAFFDHYYWGSLTQKAKAAMDSL